jgi:hypothetical protein
MNRFLAQFGYDSYSKFMGAGYGEAVFQIRKARSVEKALERLGSDVELVYESYWNGSDDRYDDYSYNAGSKWNTTTLRDVLTEMAEYDHETCYSYVNSKGQKQTAWRRERRVYKFGDISLHDVSSMFRDTNESDCGGVGELMTVEQMEQEKRERKRKDLESTAAMFASQCGHKVGTREYVLAARRAIEDVRYERGRWNDGETRMEQWAACQFAGVGSSVYYDDLNFENERYDNRLDKLGDVLDWLEEVCPLLMRQTEYEEQE